MKIIDMHCDTIMALMNKTDNLRKSNNMIDLEKLQKGDYLLQCFAMFVPYVSKDNKENYSPFEMCNKMTGRRESHGQCNFCQTFVCGNE